MNNKYKIIIDADHSLSGQEEIKEFEGESGKLELQQFLELNGYDFNEAEVAHIIDNGGVYINLDGAEFTVEVTPEEVKETKETEETQETEEVKKEENKEDKEEAKENEKNAFNNPELFIEEYKGYLVGMKLKFDATETEEAATSVITDVVLDKDNSDIVLLVNSEFTDMMLEASANDLQNLIDGETISDFHLVLQAEQEADEAAEIEAAALLAKEIEEKKKAEIAEEIKEPEIVKLNLPEYKYYLVNFQSKKIVAGFEYKEDAVSDLERLKLYGEQNTLLLRKELEIDPELNDNWNIDNHDWTIIEECVRANSDKDYSDKDAGKYIEGFKNSGKFKVVIKAQLIYCLERSHRNLRTAFTNANPERVSEKLEECNRIQNELRRIISLEN